jgi:NTP pyrophosphatase (non-canonical NTP hydrolase)
MSLDEYQKQAHALAAYPGMDSLAGIVYTTMGVCGEAGELANHMKKTFRDDHEQLTPERKKSLLGELGDILWYLSECSRELGVPLSQVAQGNLDKLHSRTQRNKIQGEGDER